MNNIYRVTIHGQKLESGDLRELLARAVREKKSLDRRLRVAPATSPSCLDGWQVGRTPGTLR